MFNFFKNFNKKQDARELPPNVPQEKGKAINLTDPYEHSSEHQEEEERINKNDLRNHLRNYVPINEISSGDEWERYGEDSDSLEEEPELEEEREELEQVIEPTATEDEIRQRIFDDFLKKESVRIKIEHKELSENPKRDAYIEHKEEKMNIKEERKIQKTMSPEKRVSSYQDTKKEYKNDSSRTSSNKENLKTMNDKKKERMAREKIAKIFDSQKN